MVIILYYNKDKTLKLVKRESVSKDIYFQKARVPSEEQVKSFLTKHKSDKGMKEIYNFFKDTDINKSIERIKKKISKIDDYIPLYDEYTRNMFIVKKEEVYNRVVDNSYRFPDEVMIEIFKKRKATLEKKHRIKLARYNTESLKHLGKIKVSEKIHYLYSDTQLNKKIENINIIEHLEREELQKLGLMIDFLDQFDLKVLKRTYVQVFYYFSNKIGKDISICTRPSFKPHFTHIKPYYRRSELINLALNMDLIKPNDIYYDQDKLMELCDTVKKNDISADIIMNHQKHIISENKIGIIQYYTLQGSFFINQYMRGLCEYDYRNPFLDNITSSLWELIDGAPEFDKSYTLYRFIKNDDYLSHLRVGDVYTTYSFESTTRDPFYKSDVYQFGFILVRIKIPAKQKGVALCIETVSNFPEEEEILLAPGSMLKLEAKDKNVPYFNADIVYQTNIKTKYEFTYIGKQKNDQKLTDKIKERPVYVAKEMINIDFLKIEKADTITISEKIRYFVSSYTNPMYQFNTLINDIKYTIVCERFDSTSAYENFYAATTKEGFVMYTIINNYIGFTIEIVEENEKSYMYVNYYFRYSSTPKEGAIEDSYLIDFIAKVAYYFGIKYAKIYCEYKSCAFSKIEDRLGTSDDEGLDKTYVSLYHGNYCYDFYQYLNKNIKRYKDADINTMDLRPIFSYYELDRLRNLDPKSILLRETDEIYKDEVYQIYKIAYKLDRSKNKGSVADFYVWMVENYCVYVKKLTKKMNRFFNHNNPFDKDYYVLDAISFLYNKNLIDHMPIISDIDSEVGPGKDRYIRQIRTDIFEDTLRNINTKLPKNKYRL